MADGDSTGTPLSNEEKQALLEALNRQLEGRVPHDEYKEKTDFIISICLHRAQNIEAQACCDHHLHFDLWHDGFFMGIMAASMGLFKFELRKLDG